MAEWISAHLILGGDIPAAVVPDLCQSIGQAGAALDWGAASFAPKTSEELLEARTEIDTRKVIRLYDDQACYGEFQELEGFLADHRIPFDRWHDAKHGISREQLVYRPEQGKYHFQATPDGKVVVQAEPLMPLIKSIQRLQSQLCTGQYREMGVLLRECLDTVQANLPPLLPPVPTLRIVSDEKVALGG